MAVAALAETTAALIQQALLGDAVDSASGFGAFVLDEHGRYVAANDFACDLSGHAREEIVREDFGSSNAQLVRECAAALEQHRFTGTTFLTRKDGTNVPVGFRASETRVGAMPFLTVFCWPLE